MKKDYPLTLRGNRARTDDKVKLLRQELYYTRDQISEEVRDNHSELWREIDELRQNLGVTRIICGIAIGMTLIFTAMLSAAMIGAGSGGQLTIIFP